jgi:hypothetical protein
LRFRSNGRSLSRRQISDFGQSSTRLARKAKSLSAKSVRNLVALLSEMWTHAKADGYTDCDPFCALRLPEQSLLDEPILTLDEMKAVIDAASEPFRTYCWIIAETGIRCGEACGLPVKNLLLDLGAIKITQKVWHGRVETVKSRRVQSAVRDFPAACRALAYVPSFLAAESAGLIVRPQERHTLGCRPRAKTQALSPTREAGDCALWISRVPARKRLSARRRGRSDGNTSEPARPFRCPDDDAIHACG